MRERAKRSARLKQDKLKKFKCEKCGTTFPVASKLKWHLTKLKRDCLRNFKCDQCNKSFSRKYDLEYHKYVHQEEYRFSCEKCGEKFKVRRCFRDHRSKCKADSNAQEENIESDFSEPLRDFQFKIPDIPKSAISSKSPTENSKTRKRKNLKIKARQVINCVMHYHFNEKNSDGSVTERWLPVFEIDDFNDVVEFEKFMAKVEIGSEEDNFNPILPY